MVDNSNHFSGPGKTLRNTDKNILVRQRMGHEDWLNSSSQREWVCIYFRRILVPEGIVEGRETFTSIVKAWIKV